MYFVYILYSPLHNRYYNGQTQDVVERLKRHNAGYEHATKPYVPWEIKLFVPKPTRSEVLALEKKIKNLNRLKLLAFIEKYGRPES